MINPLRTEIWEVDLDPTKGSEIEKRRRCVVVSAGFFQNLDVRIVVPLTEHKPKHDRYIWAVSIEQDKNNGLAKKSAAVADQVRCVALERFVARKGQLSASDMKEVEHALFIALGLSL